MPMPENLLPIDDRLFLLASLEGLRLQKRRIEGQIRLVERRLREIDATPGNGSLRVSVEPAMPRLSEAARERISQAQKRRWAAYRQRKSTPPEA